MKVGDRVKVIDNSVSKELELGELGTIVSVRELGNSPLAYPFEVQWDKDPPNEPTLMLELEIGLVE